jgi:hypothetical protein
MRGGGGGGGGGGADLGLEDEQATGSQAAVDALEQALDAVVTPVEVNPLCSAQAHYDRVGGVGVGIIYEVFPSETAVVRERERVNVAALPHVSAIFGNLD